MIRVSCASFEAFLATFATLRGVGVDAVAVGANELTVPDGTDLTLLRALDDGATVSVHTVLPDLPATHVPAPQPPPPAPTPAPAVQASSRPVRRTTRKTRSDGE